jgi:hypothetical protein
MTVQSRMGSLLQVTSSPARHHVEEIYPDTWIDDDCAVILLDAEYPEGLTLTSVLQAVGVQVFIGPHTAEAGSAPLLLVHAWNRAKPDVAFRMDMARHLFPGALVCFVTGKLGTAAATQIYEDARSALVAAGIGFVCGEFVE